MEITKIESTPVYSADGGVLIYIKWVLSLTYRRS